MRTWPLAAIALGIGATEGAAEAPARPAGPVDLDAAADASQLLAEAAGACAPAQPAFIRTRCRSGGSKPAARDFVKRYRSLAAEAAPGDAIRFTVPVADTAKGLLIAPIEPRIHCDAQVCLYAPIVTVFVRPSSPIDTRRIASVTLAFQVHDMWRARQWWGPRASGLKATLWDAQDRRLGEGTVLQPTPSQ